MRQASRRGLPAFAALVALAQLVQPAAAGPGGRITIHGAHSGSDMRLTLRGNKLVVRGRMARARPAGCRFVKRRRVAICRLRGVSAIELEMGPSGDKVEVLERLPVPLTTRLGGGSDKLIGNGERDICYPQGARRNRCVGGGGDDICITGPRNSDCVGGPGNDYCKTGSGSDGCWGGSQSRRLLHGPRTRWVPRGRRPRQAVRGLQHRPALRGRRGRLLRRRPRLGPLARVRGRSAPVTRASLTHLGTSRTTSRGCLSSRKPR
jgi:hypothetical protein